MMFLFVPTLIVVIFCMVKCTIEFIVSPEVTVSACLVITGVICDSSREKLYQELAFETLQQRLWYKKLCSFYKIFKNKSPH